MFVCVLYGGTEQHGAGLEDLLVYGFFFPSCFYYSSRSAPLNFCLPVAAGDHGRGVGRWADPWPWKVPTRNQKVKVLKMRVSVDLVNSIQNYSIVTKYADVIWSRSLIGDLYLICVWLGEDQRINVVKN